MLTDILDPQAPCICPVVALWLWYSHPFGVPSTHCTESFPSCAPKGLTAAGRGQRLGQAQGYRYLLDRQHWDHQQMSVIDGVEAAA